MKNIKSFNEIKKINEGRKRFYQKDNIGKSKYVISSHDGKKKHKDGSDFYDIDIFKNKKDLEKKRKELISKGYSEDSGWKNESVNEQTERQKSEIQYVPNFKVGDVVFNKQENTIGIVRMVDDTYGEVRTDADGMVDIDNLEHYDKTNSIHKKAHIAPSTKKEIDSRVINESHFSVGDEVICKDSGKSGEVVKLDKEHGGDDEKYYTIEIKGVGKVKYAPKDLKLVGSIDESRYKSDADIEAEFDGMTLQEIKFEMNDLSHSYDGSKVFEGMVVFEFPDAEESVAGGTDTAVEYFKYSLEENKRFFSFRVNHWYPGDVYQNMLSIIADSLYREYNKKFTHISDMWKVFESVDLGTLKTIMKKTKDHKTHKKAKQLLRDYTRLCDDRRFKEKVSEFIKVNS